VASNDGLNLGVVEEVAEEVRDEACEGYEVDRTGASSKKTERLRGWLVNGTARSAAVSAAEAVFVVADMAMDVDWRRWMAKLDGGIQEREKAS
jgi:hypothetical protein